MPLTSLGLEKVLDQASSGAPVLVSNTRAARFLQREYGRRQRAEGKQAWKSPDILTFNAWLQREWQARMLAGEEERIALSAQQERLVWESVLVQHNSAARFAGLAQQAWQLLWEYAGGTQQLLQVARSAKHAGDATPDWLAFAEWAQTFSERLKQYGWISGAQLPYELCVPGDKSRRFLLSGFDRLTPAQQSIADKLRAACALDEIAITYPAPARAVQHPVQDFASGVETAAWWARRRVLGNPDAKLAIITPQPDAQRGEITRVFTRVLGEESFQFSLGKPVAAQPVTATALLLLGWLERPLRMMEISDVMMSHFCGPRQANIRALRARLDVVLRANCKLQLPEYALRAFSEEFLHQTRLPAWSPLFPFATAVRAAEKVTTRHAFAAAKEMPSWWAARFADYLDHWQFGPGEGATGAEIQSVRGFLGIVESLAMLDFAGERYDLHWALETLERMCAEQVFQPKSLDLPVEVMGPLESAGSLFDGIFFFGAGESDWPLSGRAHPLLPRALQVKSGMPHSQRSVDLQASEQITERLTRSAEEVIFAWPKADAAGPLRPSCLLENFPLATTEELQALAFGPQRFEDATQFDSDLAPEPWTQERGTLSSGDLEAESACPYQAFAARRLNASEMEFPEDGADPRMRGNLMHKLLERLWHSKDGNIGLDSSDNLESRSRDKTLVEFVTQHAVALLNEQPGASPWDEQMRALEQERLVKRALQWLEEERDRRRPFHVAMTEESRRSVRVGELEFSLRLDRVDVIQSAAGQPAQLVLIDYKTGTADANDIQEARMPKPQLPLYAEFALQPEEGTVEAVAFGSLKPGKVGFVGLANAKDILPLSKQITVSDQRKDWREGIETLAKQFAEGDARLDPREESKTCSYCSFASLCRIAEQDLLAARAQEMDFTTYE